MGEPGFNQVSLIPRTVNFTDEFSILHRIDYQHFLRDFGR